MANLRDTPVFEAGIYQLEETDPVLGGPNGISNKQAQQLANRTLWLKENLSGLINIDADIVRGLLPAGVNACVVGSVLTINGTTYTTTQGTVYFNGKVYQVAARTYNYSGSVYWVTNGETAELSTIAGTNTIGAVAQVYTLKQYVGNLATVGKIEMFDTGFNMYDNTGKGIGFCTGWQLCNGQNGAPDLTDRFISGSFQDLSNVGTIGGTTYKQLTVANLPSHNHANGNFNRILQSDGTNTIQGGSMDSTPGEVRLNTSGTLANVGQNEPFDNRPDYYVVAFRRRMS